MVRTRDWEEVVDVSGKIGMEDGGLEEFRVGIKRKIEKEDEVKRMIKGSKEERIYKVAISEGDKAKIAFDSGITEVKLILRGEEDKKVTNNVIRIKDEIKEITEKNDKVYITRNQNLVITTNSVKTVRKVFNKSQLNGINILAKVIEDPIVTRYVIRNIDPSLSNKSIAEELIAAGIRCIQVERFTQKASNTPIPIVKITEIGKIERKEVVVGRIIYKTTKYIESPPICQNCLTIGHTVRVCRSKARCSKCGGQHSRDNCNEEIKCFRCGEKHEATEKRCTVYKSEKSARNLAKSENLNLREARQKVNKGTTTWAEVARTEAKAEGSNQQKGKSFVDLNQSNAHFESLVKEIQKKDKIIEELIAKIKKDEELIFQLIRKSEETNKLLREVNNILTEKIKGLEEKIRGSADPFLSAIPPQENLELDTIAKGREITEFTGDDPNSWYNQVEADYMDAHS